MKYVLIALSLLFLTACHDCKPIVITSGGACHNTPCGPVCNVGYALPGVGYSPVPSPSPLSDGLGPQMGGQIYGNGVAVYDTNHTTCDLNPVCKSTVAVPVPFGGSPTPIPSPSSSGN